MMGDIHMHPWGVSDPITLYIKYQPIKIINKCIYVLACIKACLLDQWQAKHNIINDNTTLKATIGTLHTYPHKQYMNKTTQ